MARRATVERSSTAQSNIAKAALEVAFVKKSNCYLVIWLVEQLYSEAQVLRAILRKLQSNLSLFKKVNVTWAWSRFVFGGVWTMARRAVVERNSIAQSNTQKAKFGAPYVEFIRRKRGYLWTLSKYTINTTRQTNQKYPQMRSTKWKNIRRMRAQSAR